MATEWALVRVGQLADSISDTHKFGRDELIFLNTSDVLLGKILHNTYSAVRDWPGQAKKSIRRDDILFSEIRPVNGHWAYVNVNAEDFVVSTKLMVIRSRRGRVVPRFLYHFLTSAQTTQWLQHLAESRSGTFPQITFDQVAELELLLPPLSIQTAIVDFLDSLNDKIELNRRMNETLEAMARALFRSWFVDFDPVHAKAEGRQPVGMDAETAALFPDRFVSSSVGEVPSGWNIKHLGQIADVNWGDTNTTKQSYVPTGYVAYSATGPDGYLPYFDYDRTGVVVSAIGHNSGVTWLAAGKWSCIKNTIRFWSTEESLSTEYLYYATYGMDKWPRRGSAQPFIAQGDARAMQVLVPGNLLASKFGTVIQAYHEAMASRRTESQILAGVRDTLLPRLLSGEIRVKDVEDVVKEVTAGNPSKSARVRLW